jgi:Transglutaminase-like superfamily
MEASLLVEAALSLLAAKAALRVLPFRWLEHLFALPVPSPELLGRERREARDDVRRAVESVARRLPVRTACFPRAMAVQSMLRRRGVGAALVYGASGGPGKSLSAHVWVEDEGVAVIGANESEGLAVLARYVPGSGLPLSSRRLTL